MAHVSLTKAASTDLDELWNYIAIDRDNPEAANQLIDDFSETFEQLLRQPGSGQLLVQYSPILRRFPVRKNYVVFYEPTDDGILIIRVLHAARHVSLELFRDIR